MNKSGVLEGIIMLPKRWDSLRSREVGSDGSMSASGSIPSGVINFNLKIFNLGARRSGDVHFLIARLYITVLD